MLASSRSRGMISVWQMDPKSLARDTAGDFYGSSAELQETVQNLDVTLLALFSFQKSSRTVASVMTDTDDDCWSVGAVTTGCQHQDMVGVLVGVLVTEELCTTPARWIYIYFPIDKCIFQIWNYTKCIWIIF